ncbi:MAG TPA: AsmA family protein, partial [Burkholderiales bacterium]|nr:AsmA family protein [Burkholderiales bacterium]
MTSHALRASSHARIGHRHIVLIAILVALVALWWAFDWNWFKHPIERRVSAATGRTFVIDGDLHVRLGLVPVIRAEGLRLSNAQWASDPDMARVGKLEVGIRLLPLLHGSIDIPMLRLDRPFLSLERNDAGEGNWEFDGEKKDESASPGRPWRIDQLVIAGGELRAHEPKLRTDLRLEINTAIPENAGAPEGKNAPGADEAVAQGKNSPAPLLLKGEGRYRDGAFQLSGRVDSPLELRDKEKPYHIDVRATAGATHAHVRGDLATQTQLEDIDLFFALSGQNLADLHKLLGIVLPDSPPYSLAGELGHKGSVWSYSKFSGTVGDSDLRGDVSVDIGRKRWLFRGDLASKELKLDDLSGFIGAGPGAKKDAGASAQQRHEAERRERDPRALPHHEYDLAKLRSMDADVKLDAAHITADAVPVQAMNVHLRLEDGLLRLDPLDMKVAA